MGNTGRTDTPSRSRLVWRRDTDPVGAGGGNRIGAQGHRRYANYNMKQHTRTGSDQAGVLTPEFIDDFSAVGSDREQAALSNQLMTDRVIPELKAAMA